VPRHPLAAAAAAARESLSQVNKCLINLQEHCKHGALNFTRARQMQIDRNQSAGRRAACLKIIL
jgi:hypothetical protein